MRERLSLFHCCDVATGSAEVDQTVSFYRTGTRRAYKGKALRPSCVPPENPMQRWQLTVSCRTGRCAPYASVPSGVFLRPSRFCGRRGVLFPVFCSLWRGRVVQRDDL